MKGPSHSFPILLTFVLAIFIMEPGQTAEKKIAGRAMPISAILSSERATVGEEVVLTESMPISTKTSVVGFKLEVYRIGVYEEKTGQIELLDPKEYEKLPRFRSFDDPKYFLGEDFNVISNITKPLNRFWITEKGISFTDNLITKGRVIKFKPLIPGAYLITAVWMQKDPGRHETVSNPVILTVLPAKKK